MGSTSNVLTISPHQSDKMISKLHILTSKHKADTCSKHSTNFDDCVSRKPVEPPTQICASHETQEQLQNTAANYKLVPNAWTTICYLRLYFNRRELGSEFKIITMVSPERWLCENSHHFQVTLLEICKTSSGLAHLISAGVVSSLQFY